MVNAEERINAWIVDFAEEYTHIALTGDLNGDDQGPDCNFVYIARLGNLPAGGQLYAFPIDHLLLEAESRECSHGAGKCSTVAGGGAG